MSVNVKEPSKNKSHSLTWNKLVLPWLYVSRLGITVHSNPGISLARLDLAIQVGPPRESPGGHLPAAIRDLAAITKLRLAHVKVY
ncbi:hypothetical protein V1477_014916 [Vespula maculifrons]|uniref:Uncharacterized protein n=1 Tax=Vespula maculifrons TaxID=7453 RepID=A0ABD2BJ58_VESMC